MLGILFAALLFYVGYNMIRRGMQEEVLSQGNLTNSDGGHPRIFLEGSFYDSSLNRVVNYQVRRIPQGLGAGLLAGGLSGLLGIGGSVVQVPVMNLLMGVPIKAAIGTGSFIVGITALGGALVYCLNGYVYPVIVAPVAIGAFLGASLGSKLAPKAKGIMLRRLFGVIIFITAVVMILKAAGVGL